jgi:hypothetical protein
MSEPFRPPLLGVPAFWPVAVAARMADEDVRLGMRNLKFFAEELKIHGDLRPELATPNVIRLNLRTMVLRAYGCPGGTPTPGRNPKSLSGEKR